MDYGSIHVLATLRFQANSRRMVKRLGEECLKKVIAFADRVKECDTVASIDLVLAAEQCKGLDAGELQLLQALLDGSGDGLMLTGDKKFLNALATTPTLKDQVDQLQGRFVSLEQIVSLLIDKHGFERVRDAVANAVEHSDDQWDSTLRSCFAGLRSAQAENVQQGLKSYIGDLKSTTKGLLWKYSGNVEEQTKTQYNPPEFDLSLGETSASA